MALSFFGPFRAWLDGSPVTGFSSLKERALLAYLAVECERSHSRDKLVGLFWPESPQTNAQASLRNSLKNLRHVLGDHHTACPFLIIDRRSVQFNPGCDCEIDAAIFENAIPDKLQPDFESFNEPFYKSSDTQLITNLQSALALYGGPFLEGFFHPDSPEFEEWLAVKRESFRRKALIAFQYLVDTYTLRGEYETALTYALRQVDLEPWFEEGHLRVMRLLAMMGQRNAALAQFEACRKHIQENYASEPSPKAFQLFERIRNGDLGSLERPPSFLSQDEGPAQQPPFFAGRQLELQRLDQALRQALAGKGQVLFISGDPGAGKTALARRFSEQALLAFPRLVMVKGRCQAYFGHGDPFLPFREILQQLTGEVEELWQSGEITQQQALRLWQLVPDSARIVVEQSPALVDVFISGEQLMDRARRTLISEPTWLDRLDAAARRDHSASPKFYPEQEALCYQFGRFLLELTRITPILVILEDLHWADAASITLLFSLIRRISSSKILLIGTFRPVEVASNPPGEPHPLVSLINETQLLYSDILINLDDIEDPSLVDSILDAEANQFSPKFRERLFNQTLGHPLFTIELLNELKRRGQVFQNSNGKWLDAAEISWEILPPRAEAAIIERLSFLPAALLDLVQAASVEGEQFTAEVLAEVLGINLDALTKTLTEELDHRYHLVHGEGFTQLRDRRLSHFRFRHILYQHFVYQQLGPAWKANLHEKTADILIKLYGNHTDEIAFKIARHFQLGGNHPLALRYYIQAGQRSAKLSANTEAVEAFSRAIELISEEDAILRFELVSLREQVFHRSGQRELAQQDIDEMESLAQKLGEAFLAVVALRRAEWFIFTWKFPEAIQQAELAIGLAQEASRSELPPSGLPKSLKEIEVESLYNMMVAADGENLPTWLEYGEKSLALARQGGFSNLEADILRDMGVGLESSGALKEGFEAAHKAMALYHSLGDRYGEGRAVNVMAICLDYEDLKEALRLHELSRQICREVGNRYDELWALYHIFMIYTRLGRLPILKDALIEARELSRGLGNEFLSQFPNFALGLYYYLEGNYPLALEFTEQAGKFSALYETAPWSEAYYYNLLGAIHNGLGRVDQARQDFLQAARIFRNITLDSSLHNPLGELARSSLAENKFEEALVYVEEYLPHMNKQKVLIGDVAYFLDYLTAYQVMQANQDERAEKTLRDAYQQLQDTLAIIPEETWRQSFLSIPWNREVITEWEKIRGY